MTGLWLLGSTRSAPGARVASSPWEAPEDTAAGRQAARGKYALGARDAVVSVMRVGSPPSGSTSYRVLPGPRGNGTCAQRRREGGGLTPRPKGRMRRDEAGGCRGSEMVISNKRDAKGAQGHAACSRTTGRIESMRLGHQPCFSFPMTFPSSRVHPGSKVEDDRRRPQVARQQRREGAARPADSLSRPRPPGRPL